jgi:Zn-dependent protease
MSNSVFLTSLCVLGCYTEIYTFVFHFWEAETCSSDIRLYFYVRNVRLLVSRMSNSIFLTSLCVWRCYTEIYTFVFHFWGSETCSSDIRLYFHVRNVRLLVSRMSNLIFLTSLCVLGCYTEIYALSSIFDDFEMFINVLFASFGLQPIHSFKSRCLPQSNFLPPQDRPNLDLTRRSDFDHSLRPALPHFQRTCSKSQQYDHL